MSFDDTARELFANPGLALLAAGGCARMAARTLSEEERAPFEGLHAAMQDWFPSEDRKQLRAVYSEWWERCVNVRAAHNNNPKHPSGRAFSAAFLQMRVVVPLVGRVLPDDSFYEEGEDDFIGICRSCAKGTSINAVHQRFKVLLAQAKKRPLWEKQCELANRMAWDWPIKETRLPSRLRVLVLDISAGARWEFVDMYGTQLLRVKGLKTTHNASLSEEDLATLMDIFPNLKPPAS